MSIFETVKDNVNLREAARLYGIDVNRHGKALCPFHDDRHPSLYVADDHYYCFSCGEHGDVIDLVSKLFQLSSYEAVLKLIEDFHLDPDKPPAAAAMQVKRIKTEAQKFREQERLCLFVLSEYRDRLRDWKKNYAPKTPDDTVHDRFVEACHRLDYVEYLLNILAYGDPGERREVVHYLLTDSKIHTLKERLDRIKEQEETDERTEYRSYDIAV